MEKEDQKGKGGRRRVEDIFLESCKEGKYWLRKPFAENLKIAIYDLMFMSYSYDV